MVLLTLGAISAFITLGVIFGIPKNGNVYTRECRTSLGKAGFLCDDRRTCIGPSALCNGQVDCANGEDESRTYCSNLPNNLPEGLVFRCANRKIWTYTDKLCDNKNDCGDCSDESVDHSCVEESGSQSNMQIFKSLHCPACQGWRCNTVFFADCDCIPKTRCNDTVQDCIDWSDEISCR
ncbi:low-density lipoprotein receptor class A domain-containing protein 1-like isoform X3 [Aquarana catesbeiana]